MLSERTRKVLFGILCRRCRPDARVCVCVCALVCREYVCARTTSSFQWRPRGGQQSKSGKTENCLQNRSRVLKKICRVHYSACQMDSWSSSFVFYSVARSLGRSLACSIGRSLGRSVARSLKGVREARCILLSPLSLETRSAVAKAACGNQPDCKWTQFLLQSGLKIHLK